MKTEDMIAIQKSLDSLRIIRRKLYSLPEVELGSLGLEDQVKYGNNLHQTSLAILKLETLKIKGTNDAFKTNENELKEAIIGLENSLTMITDSVQVIRIISDGLKIATDIIDIIN
jgi:hypothetical protein